MTQFVPVELSPSLNKQAARYLFLLACNGTNVYRQAGLAHLWGSSVHDLVKYDSISADEYNLLIHQARNDFGLKVVQPGNKGPWVASVGDFSVSHNSLNRAVELVTAMSQLKGMRLMVPSDLMAEEA